MRAFVRSMRQPATMLGVAVQLCCLPWSGFVSDGAPPRRWWRWSGWPLGWGSRRSSCPAMGAASRPAPRSLARGDVVLGVAACRRAVTQGARRVPAGWGNGTRLTQPAVSRRRAARARPARRRRPAGPHVSDARREHRSVRHHHRRHGRRTRPARLHRPPTIAAAISGASVGRWTRSPSASTRATASVTGLGRSPRHGACLGARSRTSSRHDRSPVGAAGQPGQVPHRPRA